MSSVGEMCSAKQTLSVTKQFFLLVRMCVENEGFRANHWSNVSFELHVTSAIMKQNIFLWENHRFSLEKRMHSICMEVYILGQGENSLQQL